MSPTKGPSPTRQRQAGTDCRPFELPQRRARAFSDEVGHRFVEEMRQTKKLGAPIRFHRIEMCSSSPDRRLVPARAQPGTLAGLLLSTRLYRFVRRMAFNPAIVVANRWWLPARLNSGDGPR
jgi:hypothetical protein